MPDDGFPDWMDKTGMGAVGVVTLANGEKVTAEIVGYDEERRELVLEVISPHRADGERQSIPIDNIVDFEPQTELARRMKTTQPVVARLEGGRMQPSLRTLQRLAQATDSKLMIRFEPSRANRIAR